MATSLDMSLEDRIKNRNNSVRGRGRGRGRGWVRGGGVSSRGRAVGMLPQGSLRVNTRPSAYKTAKSFSRTKDMIWRHDLFNDSMAAVGLTGVETGTKLYVSNLDYGVSNEDIKELFSEIGELKRSALHYDKNGRPSGSAEVIFVRRSDALAALKRYNNVQLDGKAMKIEIIGADTSLPVSARVQVVGANGRGRRTVVMTPRLGRAGLANFNIPRGGRVRGAFQPGRGRGGFRGRGRGGGQGGRGRCRKLIVEKSADELDRELESYHAEAMNTF
uniref:RNA and export factor-binding protein 2 n=1 Tax=Anthurium amnicola TaxID=1678845 RepID=A0A1D1YNQ1_9ARAE